MKKLVVALAVIGLAACDDKYDTKYDNVDLSKIFSNEEAMKSYADCFLDKAPCSPEAQIVKNKVPEVLETSCEKCTPKQKELAKKVVKEIKTRNPDLWKEVVQKYDPEGKYKDSFKKFMES